MRWYALHVHSQAEQRVTDRLTQARIEAFYPHKVVKSRDERRDVIQKFMPGYVFGRFRLFEKTPVVAIPQVVGILGFGRHAAAIPDFEIEAVQSIVSFPSAVPCPYVASVVAGDRVRVVRGPLSGLEGYVAYSKGMARVIVSVEMLQRSISAEVSIDSLELLERGDIAA